MSRSHHAKDPKEVIDEINRVQELSQEREENYQKSEYKSQSRLMLNNDVKRLTKEILCSKALELRLTGHTYREIADLLKMPVQTAHDYVNEATQLAVTTNIDRVRRLEIARLDLYLRRLEPQLAANDLSALDRALKIHERKSKLQGLEYRPAENPAGMDDAVKKLAEKHNISLEEANEYIKTGQQLLN